MNQLTIVSTNRDRLADNNISKFFFKSLAWQTRKDFDIIIVDAGSKNFDLIKRVANQYNKNVMFAEYKVDGPFQRALLNNVGIRTAKTPFILTTDVDMIYGPKFVETVMNDMEQGYLVESLTMYLKGPLVNRIYSGEIDAEKDVNSCKHGRIKKKTTAGGAQCMHINDWSKVRGFDESYIGWGSEDYDLVLRSQMAGIKTKWLGASVESIMLFHQPHYKDTESDLKFQEKNKQLLHNIKSTAANPEGWGGIRER